MIEIVADNSSLKRSAMGSITGLIFLRGPNGAFPQEQWSDFSVVILAWWIEGLTEVVDNQKHSFEGMFMDGPYAFRVESENGQNGQIAWGKRGEEVAVGTVNVPDLLRSAIVAGRLVSEACRVQNWSGRDVKNLEVAIARTTV
jgi:hypothetical protein